MKQIMSQTVIMEALLNKEKRNYGFNQRTLPQL